MKSNYLKQIYYDMRYQPVIGVVSVVGTALAIFFIMVVMMCFRAQVMPFAPESNRDRLLYAPYLEIKTEHGGSSSHLGHNSAERLYANLESAEETSLCMSPSQGEVTVPGMERTEGVIQYVDDAFFRIFDYDFIAGAPFDKETSDAGMHNVVISNNIARRYFGSAEAALNQKVYVDNLDYTVTGVVADVSPLAEHAYGDVFMPYRSVPSYNSVWSGYCGNFSAIILAPSAAGFDAIRAETKARAQQFNSDLAEEKMEIVDHGAPYTTEEALFLQGSNGGSDAEIQRRNRLLLYAILLIVPAINLSSMTRSRLRHRFAEIGVRRAYGARRSDILAKLLTENFLVTLAGALIGLALSSAYCYFFAHSLFTSLKYDVDVSVPASVLFDWTTFGIVIVLCFILNLLSAGLPAWQAAKVDPVDALNDRNF